jgi:hypothetical protein
MNAIKRLGLRWMLPALLTPFSAALFRYGATQDRIARALAERSGLHFGAAWHPNSPIQTVGSLDLPAMLAGVVLSNWLPEWIVEAAVFCLFVPLLWLAIGSWADNELGVGRAQGQTPPPLHERAITLSGGICAVLLLAVGILGRTFSPRFVGLFWVVLMPVSTLTGAAKWRRKYGDREV